MPFAIFLCGSRCSQTPLHVRLRRHFFEVVMCSNEAIGVIHSSQFCVYCKKKALDTLMFLSDVSSTSLFSCDVMGGGEGCRCVPIGLSQIWEFPVCGVVRDSPGSKCGGLVDQTTVFLAENAGLRADECFAGRGGSFVRSIRATRGQPGLLATCGVNAFARSAGSNVGVDVCREIVPLSSERRQRGVFSLGVCGRRWSKSESVL